MLVVLGVVPAQEGKRAAPEIAVNVLDLLLFLHFAHDQYVLFNGTAPESCRLSHKSFDHCYVILRQHGGDGIVLCRKTQRG